VKHLTLFIFVMIYVLHCTTMVAAQNARMDALGGNFCIEDPATVLQNSSSAVYYSDMFQGTAYQDDVFGPVIGIKSIGENVAVGFFANNRENSYTTFYEDALAFLDTTIDTTTELPTDFPPYPHFFAAIKLPFGTLGGEVFSKKTSHTAQTNENGTAHSLKKEIANTGFNVNASVTQGIIGVYPFMTYSTPKMLGETVSSVADSTVYSATTANNSLKYGLELNISPRQCVFTLGGVVFNEKYTFTSSHSLNSTTSKNGVAALDLYAGVTAFPTNNVVLSLVYSYGTSRYTCDEFLQSLMQSSSDAWTEKSHFAVASCEIEHNVESLAMTLFFRGGAYWYVTSTNWVTEITQENYIYNESITYPGTVSQFIPTFGVGIQKGIVSFDIASKLAGWSGIIAGFPVTTGTLTLDFKGLPGR